MPRCKSLHPTRLFCPSMVKALQHWKWLLALRRAPVPADLRPACISLMDASCPRWYIRHRAGFLHVDPTSSPINPSLFNSDSSFIVHPNMSDPGSFVLESVNYRLHYITALADGRLKIVARENITDPKDARFRVSGSTTLSSYCQTFDRRLTISSLCACAVQNSP